MPTKPPHVILKICAFIGIILALSSILTLDMNGFVIFNLAIGLWIAHIYFTEMIHYNFLTIVGTVVILIVSLLLESIWYWLYSKVDLLELE